jgi:hypothetical protein
VHINTASAIRIEDAMPSETGQTGSIPGRHLETAHAQCAHQAERMMEVCEGMIDICAALFNVSSKEIRQTGRTGQDAARVRQIAMYVTHVTHRAYRPCRLQHAPGGVIWKPNIGR